MKSKLILLALVLSVAFAPKAFADSNYTFKWYTTNDGSTTLRDTFYFGDIPYLYVHLPSASDVQVNSWWRNITDPLSSSFKDANVFTPNTNGDLWIADPLGTSTGTTEESWTVKGNVCGTDGRCISRGNSTFKFIPVPEPISSALFLLGGAGITAIRLRRNKKNIK